ncbi:MAG: phosphoenolpyruvate synthase PpsA [Desulfobacterales bacterium]|nr:phosphoenolpyruvate synthase PpsA [Desulfobacterales bacterium]MCP4163979.1 phosphoenolpyruvate synthase PpsA [Deltaproteobacteria bacterium]
MTKPSIEEAQNSVKKDFSFKIYYELMKERVGEILLISSPYDAFIVEEDGGVAERIIHEYKGLNLSRPPKITCVSSGREALDTLEERMCDLVIIMPRLDDIDPYLLCRTIKRMNPDLPIIFLSHDSGKHLIDEKQDGIDKNYIWRGNSDLLLALIKSAEDRMNVAKDTEKAKVRVIIFVEDSPLYSSTLLPYLYKELVSQTRAVMDDSLNEEDRIVRMRARPKLLHAENYEEAMELFDKYRPYVSCIITDVRFPCKGKENEKAGITLTKKILKKVPELPVLILSTEEQNRKKAEEMSAVFINKNSTALHARIRHFFVSHLGFGEFLFRLSNGKIVGRASNLRALGKILSSIPEESITYHANRNDFSTWLTARFEMKLASLLKKVTMEDFPTAIEAKEFLTNTIKNKLIERHKGVVAEFDQHGFDTHADFIKIGKGSLGGKARGLAFMASVLEENEKIHEKFPDVHIRIPTMIVITTEGFDSFVDENGLKDYNPEGMTDEEIEKYFSGLNFPDWLRSDLAMFLAQINYPLAVRSSSLLEDAHFRPCAGVYKTYMIPNSHFDLKIRLSQLIHAVKMVYASLFLEIPRELEKNTIYRTEEDKMAVIIQQLSGTQNSDFFYPSISGVAQSYNFYPISYMKAEEGIAHIALGLGQTVVEGGTAIRFSPKYPQFIPQFSKVEDILNNSQKKFYALKMSKYSMSNDPEKSLAVQKLDIDDALDHEAIKPILSSYIPQDNKIRDSVVKGGFPIITFANVLKYNNVPIPEIIENMLEVGRKGMGCPVEIEFAANINEQVPEFTLLQIRPMVVSQQKIAIDITDEEKENGLCYSGNTMGRGQVQEIHDIVYVKLSDFDNAQTVTIAKEVGEINKKIDSKYLLIGPGRWGTADRWLGIPVSWGNISNVGTIVETATMELRADPSQGSHFFHNITSLDINYMTVSLSGDDFIDWNYLNQFEATNESKYVKHIHFDKPVILKIDGKDSIAVILKPD